MGEYALLRPSEESRSRLAAAHTLKAFFINSIHKLSLKLIVMGGKDGNFILYVVQDKLLNHRKTIFFMANTAGSMFITS